MNIVNLNTATTEEFSRSKHLKAATHETHERLDRAIMAGEPFSDRDRYVKFLLVQYRFHSHVDPLYRHETLAAALPDLKARSRLALIRKDMADLGAPEPPAQLVLEDADYQLDVPTALGWLYVVEGSNLGAAFLLKEAAKLGLSEEFGARHLAAAPEGRGRHWRTFTAALDGIDLAEPDESRVVAGAEAAFRRFDELVRERFE